MENQFSVSRIDSNNPAIHSEGIGRQSMITVNQLSMNFGKQILFEEVSFQLSSGNIYGLAGANGSGKSTLLKILSGLVHPEAGEILIPNELRLGLLQQDHFEHSEERALDVTLQGKPILWSALQEKNRLTAQGELNDEEGHRLAVLEGIIADQEGYQAEAQAAELLHGLGVKDPLAKLKEFSGGYRIRILLAQCLFSTPDFIMLDEPTNHLDLSSIHWLEQHLQAYAGGAVIISHDRHFLNRVCTHILDIDYETVRQYKGNYDRFMAQKALEREQKENEIERQEKKKEDLQAFVDRFKAKASKAKQAASRAKQIEKMDEITIKRSNRVAPNFRFLQIRPSGREALKIKNLSKYYGEHKVIHNLSLSLERGQRLAVIGPNGIGKSTLLKILASHIEPTEGLVEFGHELRPGYFPQDHHEILPKDTTPYEWLYSFEPGASIGRIRGTLGAVLLQGDQVHKLTQNLSGGEAARLILAQLMLLQPNLLLIDEPTNHMDIESIDALSKALKSYEGTVILVSHDRAFIESSATQVLELTYEGFRHFPGSYKEFIEKEGLDYLDRSGAKAANTQTASSEQTQDKPLAKTQCQLTGKELFKAQKEAKNLKKRIKNKEERIQKLETDLTALEEEITQNQLFAPGKETERATAEDKKKALANELAPINAKWEEEQGKLEELLKKLGEA